MERDLGEGVNYLTVLIQNDFKLLFIYISNLDDILVYLLREIKFILFYSILFYSILFYSILFYSILFYS